MKSCLILVACLFGMVSCDEERLGDTGQIEQNNLLIEFRISQGLGAWGHIPHSWVGGLDGFCVNWPNNLSSVGVSNGDCGFTISADTCKCVSKEEAHSAGVEAGVWCYGQVTGIDFGDGQTCSQTDGLPWPPPGV